MKSDFNKSAAMPEIGMRGSVRLVLNAGLFSLAMAATQVSASTEISYAEEFTRKIEAAKAVGPLGEDAFGESSDWNTGQTNFRVVDIALPGNSALPVQLARTLAATLPDLPTAELIGEWAIDLPYVGGIFSKSQGWANNRCSSTAAPSPVTNGNGKTFQADEFWRGNSIYIPGKGSTHLLKRSTSYTKVPSDGSTYTWVTADHTQTTCGISVVSGGSGEGFIAVTADGLRYTFDRMLKRESTVLVRDPSLVGGDWLERDEIRIYASKVEDRFGNWVQYQWTGSQLTGISANDGRAISLTYLNGYLNTATAHGRTWTYGYSGSGLISVTLPDNSTWTYSGTRKKIIYDPLQPASNPCNLPDAWSAFYSGPFTLTMKHPSGVTGAFTYNPVRHTRTVSQDKACKYIKALGENEIIPGISRQFDTYSLSSKTLSGPGLTAATWSVSYGGTANNTKTVTLTRPDNSKLRYTFGTRFYLDEGKLLLSEVLKADGTTASQTASTYATAPTNPPYAFRVGTTGQQVEDAFSSVLAVPTTRTEITQDSVVYTAQVNTFDSYARPISLTRSNSLGSTRTDLTSYHDNTTRWVLGQVSQQTTNGTVASATGFDSSYALPITQSEFGVLQQTIGYDTTSSLASGQRGTVATLQDGLNRLTTASNWKRGIPQTLVYADSASESAVVNDRGLIDSVTDEKAYLTAYGYDAMNRLNSTTHPTGDVVSWTNPTITYAVLASAELGMPIGSWRVRLSEGRHQLSTYYDALLRPVLIEDKDTTTGIARYTKTAYDYAGRATFESYPSTSSNPTTGINTTYDALGRLTLRKTTDNITLQTVAYLSGNRKQITDADGKVTTISYQAFDQPDYSKATRIEAPETQLTVIDRDVFGKITGITQSGTYAGSPISQTRSFQYDNAQRPCRRIDPESGSTVWGYNAASEVVWEAKGQSGTGCLASAPAGATAYEYWPRSNKKKDDYPGTADDVSYGYDAALNLSSVVNGTASWSYTYNKRNLLETEQAVLDGKTFLLDPTYNGLGQISSRVTPGQTISTAPDAWGRPTQLGSYASSVQYHPNGLTQSYTLGSGLTVSQTLDSRLRPWVQETKNGSTAIQKVQYGYSPEGDLLSFDDQASGADDATLTYDNLHRLSTATGLWGSYSYAYDPLNNLRTRTHSGGTASLGYAYNATSNRLTGISGSQTRSYSYNAQGEITGDGSKVFTLNPLGQISSITGIASYGYDGNGKRIKTVKGANTEYALYDRSGALVYTETATDKTDYLSLNGQTIVELKKVGSTTTPSYLHPDLLGSPRMATTQAKAISWQEHFDPYGSKLNNVAEKIGYTGHAFDPETNYTYAQARFYDPLVGRFLSTDPIHFTDDNPFTFNRYAYANNNPYKYTDPNGQFAFLLPFIPPAAAALVDAVAFVGSAAVAAWAGSEAINAYNESSEAPGPTPEGTDSGGSTLQPGPHAGDSIPARGPGRDFTPGEREKINEIGGETGCHTCGTKEPGTKSGNWVPDHQPPSGTNTNGQPQQLYPQCLNCSRTQGGEVRQYKPPPPPPPPEELKP